MRIRWFTFAFAASSLALVALASPTWGQPKRGGFGGGSDPNVAFDTLSKGRGYILISEISSFLRKPLQDYAQSKGISSDRITREQWVGFSQDLRAKMTGMAGGGKGGGGFGGGKGGFGQGGGQFGQGGFGGQFGQGTGFGQTGGFGGQFPQGIAPGGPTMQSPQEAMDQWIEADFKRRDFNGDGFLNSDEMSAKLRDNLAQADTNKDGLIDLPEYKTFMRASLGIGGTDKKGPDITILVQEEDLEKRPTVYGAGKLPKEGLPKWFEELDADKDGQVGLYEWRKGGKDMDEFSLWDRNDDGLITIEEAMRLYSRQTGASTGTTVSATPMGSGGNGNGKKINLGGLFGGKKKTN